ncbi:class I SAM-dependent methyltransferase [Pseudanabaena sp. ABRG5-3]|uniref:class I SAM-dependent methyltransferase n=1 Tax=Pseudanabaena sp. ABRG5-3 TaxID=685565 RepID=UPI000DC6D251|nr:class I SAM-dependent methyltransferase [Pseudanabaena sp. ABRG5-3]BBC22588.1 type 11 methyltransferase [Pseudanabaena sp. ABRG5-3]
MTDLPNLRSSQAPDIASGHAGQKSWTEVVNDYAGKDLGERKTWYGSVADAYNRVRPRYPSEIIDRTLQLAQLPPQAKILELGCGPAIATVNFAKLGFSLLSLEPNLEAATLAKQNCAEYPQVEIQNLAFEEWELERDRFDAVLAATSWHWLDPAIAYEKSAAALKANGVLILLWNTPPQLDEQTYQLVDEIYQSIAPSIPLYARHEGRKTHQADFLKFSQTIIDSGHFHHLSYDSSVYKVTYSLDDYLLLLSTLSPYIALTEETRISLFAKLREALYRNRGDRLNLSFISAFHVAHKI